MGGERELEMEIEYSVELKEKSDEKKLFNINAFSELNRSGLSYGGVERRMSMREFSTGEKLYIQYPGKETVRSSNPRPWDFRPKLQLPNGEWLKDLSFKDVWDDLYAFKDIAMDMSYVATLFFRIAYMMDVRKTTRNLPYEDVDVKTGDVIRTGEIELTWYEYEPDDEILSGFQVSSEAIKGCSVPAYLMYNDYLAQNEDCKYYYRAVCEKGEKWRSDTGRRNTLLTHMSVIAFIENMLRFTEITDMFQRGLGVAALPRRYWEEVTGGRVAISRGGGGGRQ